MKVFIYPRFDWKGEDRGDGGIRRVISAQRQWLPEFGVEVVESEAVADVVAVHAGSLIPTNKPIVSHNHGLYWTKEEPEWSAEDGRQWALNLNEDVIDTIHRAEKVTAVSNWVAHAIQRGTLISPTVIYHGVNLDEWEQGKNEKYVLWNKTRPDPTCKPGDVIGLAELALDTEFVTTYGRDEINISVIGRQPYEAMKTIISNAGAYLATARETFGIGTLEAMACGVPVIGWDWGGQSEIIRNKETGYLVPPGDFAALREALLYVQKNRKEIGQNARQDVIERWQWKHWIPKYAKLYEEALEEHNRSPKVSVIIPCYNQSQYLKESVQSILNQNMTDWELIIVNDASPDNTGEIADELASQDDRISVIHNKQNLYLSEARNTAMRVAKGKYFIPLDADDKLEYNALELLTSHLEVHNDVHITYGALKAVNEETGEEWVSTWPPDEPDFNAQIEHKRNQIPYASMYRRRVWENLGGYRRRMHTAEDAEFWTRAFSYGYKAQKATNAPVLIKLEHPDSMGYTNEEPEWNSWFTWKTIKDILPFGSVMDTDPRKVSSYSPSLISVIIPVRPGHDYYLQDALDSLLAQSYPYWEVIIVNDGDKPFKDKDGNIINKYLQGFPFVTIYDGDGDNHGPGWARNKGIELAKGPLIALLDADDYFQPFFLEFTLKAYKKVGGYVYTDWYTITPENILKEHQAEDWSSRRAVSKMISSITTLFPKTAWEEIGGFDERVKGWEDWDFQLSLLEKGWCGVRVAAPLFTYRFKTGQRREDSFSLKDKLLQYITKKHKNLYEGKFNMACSKCPGGANNRSTLHPTNSVIAQYAGSEFVKVKYIGPMKQSHRVKNPATGQVYKFGGNPKDMVKNVWKKDEEFFRNKVDFQILTEESTHIIASEMIDPITTHETEEPLRDDTMEIPTVHPPAPAQTAIEELNLKQGIVTSLKSANLHYIEDIEAWIATRGSEDSLLDVSGIGKARLGQILDAIRLFRPS